MALQNRIKSNCDVIANFSLIFRNSKFIMKIKFPSYVTRKFYLYLMTLKFPSYTTSQVSLKIWSNFIERII